MKKLLKINLTGNNLGPCLHVLNGNRWAERWTHVWWSNGRLYRQHAWRVFGHLTVSFTGIYTFVNCEQIYKFPLVHMNMSRFFMLSPPFLNSYIIFQYNWEMKSRLLLSCKNCIFKALPIIKDSRKWNQFAKLQYVSTSCKHLFNQMDLFEGNMWHFGLFWTPIKSNIYCYDVKKPCMLVKLTN